MILSDALILSVSQPKTQQVMTSQIRSHIEYDSGLLFGATLYNACCTTLLLTLVIFISMCWLAFCQFIQ